MLYAVGDIHGCLKALKDLLGKLPLVEGDEVLFLGDYIDRGPESRQVVDFLLKEKRPNWRFLRGNHEQLILDWLSDANPHAGANWLLNGGYQTLAAYVPKEDLDEVHGEGEEKMLKRSIPTAHVEFFKSLPFFYETKDVYFCHAGVDLDKPLKRQSPDDLLWIRKKFLLDVRPTPKLIVHGHTPVAAVEVERDRINIDTGCVYGGLLTALSLPGKKVYQSRQ
jgi:serine/threonine protein phosphatase 1